MPLVPDWNQLYLPAINSASLGPLWGGRLDPLLPSRVGFRDAFAAEFLILKGEAFEKTLLIGFNRHDNGIVVWVVTQQMATFLSGIARQDLHFADWH